MNGLKNAAFQFLSSSPQQTIQKLNIINLGPEFSKFWNTAKDKSFQEQLKLCEL
jgi:hypothetical protein